MDGIKIAVETAPNKTDIFVVKISGYIDTTTSSELERVLQNLLREQRFKIVMDLGSVEYISSAGWGIFISEIKNIRMHNGDLKLASMSLSVSEVYELLEFSTILTAAPTVPEAIRMFDGAAAAAPAGGSIPAQSRPIARPVAPPVAPIAPTPVSRPPAPPLPAGGPVRRDVGTNPPRIQVTPGPPRPVQPSAAPIPVAPIRAAAPMPPALPIVPKESPAAQPLDPLTLPERVKAVIRSYPEWGAWKIKKELNRRRGNLPKTGWGEVREILRNDQLNSKAARYNYARPKKGEGPRERI